MATHLFHLARQHLNVLLSLCTRILNGINLTLKSVVTTLTFLLCDLLIGLFEGLLCLFRFGALTLFTILHDLCNSSNDGSQ